MAWVVWYRLHGRMTELMPGMAEWRVHRRYQGKSAEMALAHLCHARSDLWEFALTGAVAAPAILRYRRMSGFDSPPGLCCQKSSHWLAPLRRGSFFIPFGISGLWCRFRGGVKIISKVVDKQCNNYYILKCKVNQKTRRRKPMDTQKRFWVYISGTDHCVGIRYSMEEATELAAKFSKCEIEETN